MNEQTYLLSFDEISEIEANRSMEKSREVLLAASNKLAVQRQRENPLISDIRTSQALIMGIPAFVVVVLAIGNWLQKCRSASLTIVIENPTLEDAAQLLRLFLTQNTEHKESTS